MTIDGPRTLYTLFDLARTRVRRNELGRYVMGDPGTGDYIATFEAILERGAPAIEYGFDLTENLGWGVNWKAAPDDGFRWFRVLTSSISLFLRDRSMVVPAQHCLVMLLVDLFALQPSSPQLRDALKSLCQELPSVLSDPRESGFFHLGELVLHGAEPAAASPERIEVCCAALEEIEARCEPYYVPDGGEWAPNRWFNDHEGFVWGWTHDRQLHPIWLHLVQQHVPKEPERVAKLRQRLLDEGAPWVGKRHRLS